MTEKRLTGLVYRGLYKIWRLLPDALRGRVYRVRWLNRTKASVRDAAAAFAGRDDIYNVDYYRLVDQMAGRSVEPISASMVVEFKPRTVVDVGCGTGALLMALARHGVPGTGLEYSESALEVCRQRRLDVEKFDLTRDALAGGRRYDVAISTEVAEHILAEYADRLVGLIVAFSDNVVFTAATPGQGGGTDHVNEQPHEYWLRKFADQGFAFDEPVSLRWRSEWRSAGVEACYFQNVMVFRKRVMG